MNMTFDYRFYLSLLRRRLHYALAILALSTVAGIVLAYTLPPVYRAEARLLVENPQIPDELAASTVSSTATEILLAIQQRILTHSNLLDLSRKFGIHAEATGMPEDAIVADMRNRITMALPGMELRTGVVTVSFGAPTPGESAAVTNEIVEQILRQNVELRTGASGGTLDFFQQEVKRLSQEIGEQNARILEFEQANRNALPESLEFRRSRQSAQQERLLQVERELAGLRDRRQRLADLYEQTGRLGPTLDGLSPEQVRLEELRQELASALVIYSPDNPRVRALQTQVAALEQAVRQQIGGGTGTGTLSAFDLQIADIDGQIDFLAEQKALLEKELADLAVSIEATPANAIALGELQSDFENLRVQYDQAVQSLADARMGDRIEVTARGQRIIVVDPAIPPSEPAAPNRNLILLGGFAVGLVGIMAMLFLTDLLNRTVRRPAELVTALGITPFGTIPYITTREEERRQRALTRRTMIIAGVLLPVLIGVAIYLMMPSATQTTSVEGAVPSSAAEAPAEN